MAPEPGIKRLADSLTMESLQRKKFKASELPLSPVQHKAIDSLRVAFKKKGSFDNVRKNIWNEFNDSVHFTLSCDLAQKLE